jgi:hypothetical protein
MTTTYILVVTKHAPGSSKNVHSIAVIARKTESETRCGERKEGGREGGGEGGREGERDGWMDGWMDGWRDGWMEAGREGG